jgi:DNA/RNA-binding protein KIN17
MPFDKNQKSNRMGKLKYYCQMCNKQCWDANGLKNHSDSDSHKAQMKLYLENPLKYVEEFSEKFQEQFIEALRDLSKGDWITAQEVYKYIVADNNHVHMNATRWTTLTEFLDHLEKSGILHKRSGEKGGVDIRFIDLDGEKRIEREQLEQKRRLERQQEIEARENDKRMRLVMEAQASMSTSSLPTQISRADPSSKIQISLSGFKRGQLQPVVQGASDSTHTISQGSYNINANPQVVADSSRMSTGCVVKIKSGAHREDKGTVKAVTQDSCRIELVKSPDTVVWIPHSEIETVIPSLNRIVKIVKQGISRTGELGILYSVDVEKGTASVIFGADEPEDFKFDDICKVVTS